MDNERLHFLLGKIENQTASLAEQQEIDEFYQSFDKQPNFTDTVTNLAAYEELNALKISSVIDSLQKKNQVLKLKRWMWYAAAVLLISLSLFLVLKPKLDGIKIITTERGETKEVQLPDGTQVILNAASKLIYSVNFIKERARVVELSGEAYFEVSKDKNRPFIVKTRRQKIEVLGTRFNVNAYEEEESTITTLFEGSIKIFSSFSTASVINDKQNISRTLLPGERSILTNHSFKISNTTEENALAWKYGIFCFDEDSFQRVMNKISRRYNVDVIYADGLDKVEKYDEHFNGRLSKSVDLQRILEIIEHVAPVKFTVKEDSVIVKLIQ